MPIYHKVRNNIQQYRKGKYTQVEFAELMGVKRGTITLWENNKTQPKTEKWEAIADLLDQPESVLFYLQD